MRRISAPLLLLALAAGCGGDEYSATRSEAAELHVVQVWDESAGLYAEGALSYLAVEAPDGDELIEAELAPADKEQAATLRLDPGTYRLVSWQRPCEGNCGTLDPPTDRCEQVFTLEPSTPVKADIEVRAGRGCTIRFN